MGRKPYKKLRKEYANTQNSLKFLREEVRRLSKENTDLHQQIGGYEAMKRGVAIRIAGLEYRIRCLQDRP